MKSRYNIILQDGGMQEQTLATNDVVNMEVLDSLPMINGIVSMNLTEEEAELLQSQGNVLAVEKELDVIEEAQFPRNLQDQTIRTRTSPLSTTPGETQTSTFFSFQSDMSLRSTSQPLVANTGPLGFFINSPENEDASVPFLDIEQNYAGNYVDIVAIEAGAPVIANDVWENHVDTLDDNGSSRFVRTDWNVYNNSISTARNLQATNGNTMFSSHAIGVLSAAGGLYCGWAKVSSLRVIYLSDGVTTAYDAVLNFHQNKPVNPTTGVRNATITTGAWGYSGLEHQVQYKIDDINQITDVKSNGDEVITNRPAGGWNGDYSAFVAANLSPRVVEDPVDQTEKWFISVGSASFGSTFDTLVGNFASTNGIYHFKSAGNNSGVGVKYSDPAWNTRCATDAGDTVDTDLDGSGDYMFTTTGRTARTIYPLRAYASSSSNCYVIGACQHSSINRLPDDYSNRGPYIDLWAHGAYTWTSYPSSTYDGGYKWGFFSGTSCAAPVAAGAGAIFVDWFFDTTGKYPTHDQLLEAMQRTAKEVMISENLIDWTNAGTAGATATSDMLYSSNRVNKIVEGFPQNGGSDLSDLYGSTTKRVFIPNYIRMNTKSRSSSETRRNFFVDNEQETKQLYPRRKIRLG